MNYGIRQNSILIHLFFCFYFNCLPDDVLCKVAIWADDTALNSSSGKPSDLFQQAEIAMSCNLIVKIKIVGKHFYFLSATFWFWSAKIWSLKLSSQGQTLKAVIQNWFKKSCFKDLEFLTENLWNFTKNVLWKNFPSLFIAVSSIFVYKFLCSNLKH